MKLALLLIVGCGGARPTATAVAAKEAGAPTCLAGDCTTGKGAMTRGAGAHRALYEGAFVDGHDEGNGTITRVAGETLEALELDATTATGTIRTTGFSVIGQVTNLARNAADDLPELVDDGAAVMLPTGEFLFADWSATTVAPKDSNLTAGRRVPRLPEDYADLLAGAAILEDARRTGRQLELRVPGRTTELRKHAIATLEVYASDGDEPVVYIVGVGVPDPANAATAQLRAGHAPTGMIPIIRADGRSGMLELAHDAVVRWPTFDSPASNWRATITARGATYHAALGALDHALEAARDTGERDSIAMHLRDAIDAGATAQAAVDDAIAALPGAEAARLVRLRALASATRTLRARAELAARIVTATDADHAGQATAAFADALAAIATTPLATSAFE